MLRKSAAVFGVRRWSGISRRVPPDGLGGAPGQENTAAATTLPTPLRSGSGRTGMP
ncbi:hypothetical protein OG206_28190 [Streptomyces sp. NBC_01341]|uniref:hypothetical protein n=1 Tax=Streptomyces sp. NBC_01341 TaxID=2903831 RepID=UPI002E0E9CFD|nr:hypothetical protein OG206_28190 [Streptomyces sp. NBC_01341]